MGEGYPLLLWLSAGACLLGSVQFGERRNMQCVPQLNLPARCCRRRPPTSPANEHRPPPCNLGTRPHSLTGFLALMHRVLSTSCFACEGARESLANESVLLHMSATHTPCRLPHRRPQHVWAVCGSRPGRRPACRGAGGGAHRRRDPGRAGSRARRRPAGPPVSPCGVGPCCLQESPAGHSV